jgi:glutamate dehydrogenase
LSVPSAQLRESAGLAELTRLFSQPASARQLLALSTTVSEGASQQPAAFAQAVQAVDAIEGMADFLFAALSVPRPTDMALPAFLQVGMRLRHQTGIDGLERMLMQSQSNPSQEALRGHALQALRRAQQRLLGRVLQSMPVNAERAVETVIGQLKIDGHGNSNVASLEHAVLDVWTLSEAASSMPAAA